ncbi:MAG: hypothetical protein NTW29_00795 [Bacteroidetes bacterium]|nr:hypothetical protein [Bacteroidota bacterium]
MAATYPSKSTKNFHLYVGMILSITLRDVVLFPVIPMKAAQFYAGFSSIINGFNFPGFYKQQRVHVPALFYYIIAVKQTAIYGNQE